MRTTIYKALTAAAFTGVTALGTALMDGDLTTAEALTSLGMALVAGGATYAVPYTVRRG